MTQYITIKDTGKRQTTSSSAEETDIVNSGTIITLFGVEVVLEYKAVLNKKPVVGKTEGGDPAKKFVSGEVDQFGIEKPKWTIRGILNFDDSTDRSTIQHLKELVMTKGYKELGGDLPDLVDGVDNDSKVNVRVEDVKMQHRSNSNIIDYSITLWETD
jgi:hypothetical protein